MSGFMLMGSPAALMALLTSFRPLPVTMETTDAFFSMRPVSTAFLTPAVPAAPAGSANTPAWRPSIRMASMISSSLTFTMTPSDSLMARRALTGLRGTPTAIESAKVFSSWGTHSMVPAAAAVLMGQQPEACTLMRRGRRSIRPAMCRSLNPFQTPAMVQPSPTETAT